MAFWSVFSHKKEWGNLLERILYTSRYSIIQELLQLLDEVAIIPIIHYSCHITEAEGEVGYP